MGNKVIDKQLIYVEAKKFRESGEQVILERIVEHFCNCCGDMWVADAKPYVGEKAYDIFKDTVRRTISSSIIMNDKMAAHVVLALISRLKGIKYEYKELNRNMEID